MREGPNMKIDLLSGMVSAALKPSNINVSPPESVQVELASQADPNAIKPDHGENSATLPKPNVMVNDRARALAEIHARHDQVAGGNEGFPEKDDDGNDVESSPQVDSLETGVDLPTDGEPVVAEAAPTPVKAAPEEMREVIVNGQHIQVPLSRIIADYQKSTAADAKLEQASALLAEATRIARQPSAQPDVERQPEVTALNDDQLAELIQFGTKEQAAQAIKALRQGAQPAVKPEDIVQLVRQTVAPTISFEKAKEWADSEYGDILRDPDLGAIFLNREQTFRRNGDQRGYTDLYKAIGDDMRQKFNRPKAGQPNTQTVTNNAAMRSMQEKQAAKAAAPAAPKLASARMDGDGVAQRAPTSKEIIDQQRRSRGFDTLNRR